MKESRSREEGRERGEESGFGFEARMRRSITEGDIACHIATLFSSFETRFLRLPSEKERAVVRQSTTTRLIPPPPPPALPAQHPLSSLTISHPI